MFKRLLEVDGYKVFKNYIDSVNSLYNMYCEMKNKINENEIDIYDKAKELDNYYEEINGKIPQKLLDVRQLIVKEYKEFNPENEKVFYKSGRNPHTDSLKKHYIFFFSKIWESNL